MGNRVVMLYPRYEYGNNASADLEAMRSRFLRALADSGGPGAIVLLDGPSLARPDLYGSVWTLSESTDWLGVLDFQAPPPGKGKCELHRVFSLRDSEIAKLLSSRVGII